mgnify:CR=1 FL=1
MVSQQIAQQQTSLSSVLVQKGDGGEQMFFNPGNGLSHNPLQIVTKDGNMITE